MSDEETKVGHISPFEAIRKEDENSIEYWSARELCKLLGYREYRFFKNAIQKAEEACKQSGQIVADHFVHTHGMIGLGKGAKRKVDDVHLSRYSCYLIVQNADPEKPIVALGQTYFAVQTRRQELADELAALPEDRKRLMYRSEMAIFNAQLAEAAQQAGVIEAFDFAIFQNHGYSGLYGGLRENDIHTRKNLKPQEKILDYMGSEELGANIFRATQTDAKLRREQIIGKEAANLTHQEVGKIVRKAISEAGGTMPEDLPTPEKSIQELQRKEQKQLDNAVNSRSSMSQQTMIHRRRVTSHRESIILTLILHLFKHTSFGYSRGTWNARVSWLGKRDRKGCKQMDQITTAIVAALSAGAVSGLTEASKTAITDGYNKLKDLLSKKFGAKSDVVQALDQLEAKPESVGRKETLQEEISVVKAEQESEVMAAAQHLLTLVQSQQTGMGKFTIQNNGPVQGQNIGDHLQVTQHFGDMPKT